MAIKINNKNITKVRINSSNINTIKFNGHILFSMNTTPEPPKPEYITNPTLRKGEINQKNGNEVVNNKYLITDFLNATGARTLTISNNIGSSQKVFLYDKNKKFIKNWLNDGGKLYSHKYVTNGGSYTIPVEFTYIRIRIHSGANATLTIKYS